MKSNARAAVLALLGTAVITLVSVGTQTMEGSTGLIVTAIVSFLVMLAVVYADRNLKRARRVIPWDLASTARLSGLMCPKATGLSPRIQARTYSSIIARCVIKIATASKKAWR